MGIANVRPTMHWPCIALESQELQTRYDMYVYVGSLRNGVRCARPRRGVYVQHRTQVVPSLASVPVSCC